VRGHRAAHVVAFARRHSSSALVAVCGRLIAAPLIGGDALTPSAAWWGDTRIVIPADLVDSEMRDALHGGAPRPFGEETRVADLLGGPVPTGLWTLG